MNIRLVLSWALLPALTATYIWLAIDIDLRFADGAADSSDDPILARVMKYAAGYGAVVLMYLTWRRTTALERRNDVQDQQLAVAREEQKGDRFAGAVTLLAEKGEGALPAQLGGIYSLESLANGDPTYSGTVFELLTAYVRSHYAREFRRTRDGGTIDDPPLMTIPSDPPAPVLQAIIDVCGRRVAHGTCAPFNFSSCGLNRMKIGNAEFQLSDFSLSALQRADLEGAHLDGAIFYRSNLCGANLQGADLIGAKLIRTRLEGAKLRGADLTGAMLAGANLHGADLEDVTLDQADWDSDTIWPDGFSPISNQVRRDSVS